MQSPLLKSKSVSSITITLTVNSVASATVTTFPDGTELVRGILTKASLAAMASAQKARLTSPPTPDSTLTFKVNDTNLTMKGYGVSPQIGSSKARYEQGFSIVGADAALDAIDMSIYRFSDSFETIDVGDMRPLREIFDSGDATGKGNFPLLLKSIMQQLVSYYPRIIKEVETPSASKRDVIRAQHQINNKLLPQWYKVLDNSSIIYSDWSSVIDRLPKLADNLIGRIMTSVRQPGGFWNVLMSLLGEFRIAYIPALSGPGKLIKLEDKMKNGSGGPVTLSATAFALTDGSVRLLPIGAVTVIGDTPWALQPTETQTGDQSLGLLARYPAKIGYGYVLTVPPPLWIQVGGKDALNALEIGANGEDVNPMTLDADAESKSALKDQTASTEKHENLAAGLLVNYAKAIFEEVQYADSRIKAALPAMPNELHPGERRKFQTGDGGSFSAFVNSVTYTMTLADGQLMVSAAVDLTHVKF